uniref:Uncharacterized protein n=1 Tax=Schizaphis graminum TaxID=13262 RepID=A0A2S2P6H8_SCHGA
MDPWLSSRLNPDSDYERSINLDASGMSQSDDGECNSFNKKKPSRLCILLSCDIIWYDHAAVQHAIYYFETTNDENMRCKLQTITAADAIVYWNVVKSKRFVLSLRIKKNAIMFNIGTIIS